jgi:nucleotide-binding universal stress UspA family protein
VDSSEGSRKALDAAVALAGWHDATLTLLHVRGHHGEMDMRALSRFTAHLPPAMRQHVLVESAADVAEAIMRVADEDNADLIVAGSHGRAGMERRLLGSVSETLVHHAQRPVLIVPRCAAPPALPRFGRILCAVDFSDGSRPAVQYALALAQEFDAQLDLLHVVALPDNLAEGLRLEFDYDQVRTKAVCDARGRLDALVPADARLFCTVEPLVRFGAPYAQVLAAADARRAALIVMGAQGRGALDRLVFGSNTARVLRRAPCPVLVVPRPEASPERAGHA